MKSSKTNKEVKITYKELKEINYDDIVWAIPKETALKLSRNSFRAPTVSASDILNVWLNKLLRAYALNNLSAAEWQEIIIFLKDVQGAIMAKLNKQNMDAINDYGAHLRDLNGFAKWALENPNILYADQDETLPFIIDSFLLNAVSEFCDIYEKFEEDKILHAHTLYIVELHTSIIAMMNNTLHHLESQMLQTTSQSQTFVLLLPLLCDLSEHIQAINLKLMLECFKIITRICSHYLRCTVQPMDTVNVTQPITTILMEVGGYLTTVYSEASMAQSIVQIEKFLNITNFYINLVHKIMMAAMLKVEQPIVDLLLRVLVCMRDVPVFMLKQPEIINLVVRYVQPGVLMLLQLLCQNEDMLSLLLIYVEEHRTETVCFKIVIDFLHVLLQVNDDLSNKTYATLTGIFSLLLKEAHFFITPTPYEELIERYAALTLTAKNTIMLKYFVTNITKDNFILAHASTDILLLFLNMSNSKKSIIKCLLPKNYAPELFSIHGKHLHLQRLQATRLNGDSGVSKCNYDLRDCSLLKRLHPKNSKILPQPNVLMHILKQIFNKLDEINVLRYYEMLVYMQLLANANAMITFGLQQELNLIIESAYKMLKTILKETEPEMGKVYKRFIDSYFQLLLNKAPLQIQLITIKKLAPDAIALVHKNCAISLPLLKLLHKPQVMQHQEKILTHFKKVKSPEVKLIFNILNALNEKQTVSANQVLVCNYMNLNYNRTEETDDINAKRLCLRPNYVHKASLLHDMLDKSMIVKKWNESEINATERALLKQIIENLSIVNCKFNININMNDIKMRQLDATIDGNVQN